MTQEQYNAEQALCTPDNIDRSFMDKMEAMARKRDAESKFDVETMPEYKDLQDAGTFSAIKVATFFEGAIYGFNLRGQPSLSAKTMAPIKFEGPEMLEAARLITVVGLHASHDLAADILTQVDNAYGTALDEKANRITFEQMTDAAKVFVLLVNSNVNGKKMQEVAAVQDDSSHWYVIPKSLSDSFYKDLDDENSVDSGSFDEKYGNYRTGGDLNLVQLYAPLK